MWETWVWSLGWEDPWRRKWQPTPVFLPRKSHGQRSLIGYSPWGHKESDMTVWLHFQFQCQWSCYYSISNLHSLFTSDSYLFSKNFCSYCGHTVFNNWTILSSILSSSHLLNIKIMRAGVDFYIVSLINHRTKYTDRCRKSPWKSFLMIMWFIFIAIQMIQEAL